MILIQYAHMFELLFYSSNVRAWCTGLTNEIMAEVSYCCLTALTTPRSSKGVVRYWSIWVKLPQTASLLTNVRKNQTVKSSMKSRQVVVTCNSIRQSRVSLPQLKPNWYQIHTNAHTVKLDTIALAYLTTQIVHCSSRKYPWS